MSAINTLCAKFISVNKSRAVIGWLQLWPMLTALLPSVVRNSKWQLTRVKRCRSKPPSFPCGRPTCHGVARLRWTCKVRVLCPTHKRVSVLKLTWQETRNMYTFLCISLLLSDICFLNMYFLWSYFNARDKTLLSGIWITLALWWGCHRLTEGWIGVLNKLRFSWVFSRTSRRCAPQVWTLEQLVVWITQFPTHKTSV
jgi:hypothetical protein